MADLPLVPPIGLSYCQLFGFVLLAYDYCLTLSQEVERVWEQKLTGPVLLFLVNRYLGLIYQIICLGLAASAFESNGDVQWNVPIENFKEVTAIILVAVCELIMTLRVYALFGCNHILLGVLLTLIVAQFVLIMCFTFVIVGQVVQRIFSDSIDGIVTNSFALWTSALVIDTIIFILTLRRTYTYSKASRSAPLLHLFFRDGVVYFLVIGTSDLMNILSMTVLSVAFQNILSSQFCASITALLVSRLVLNIRIGNESDPYRAEHQSSISALMIGNLGGAMDELVDDGTYGARNQQN